MRGLKSAEVPEGGLFAVFRVGGCDDTVTGMLKIIDWTRARAERYHRCLPDEVRQYLKGRGIPATLIERQKLGWDGKRITIPIFGLERDAIVGIRYVTPPTGLAGAPTSERGAKPDLYGWETLRRKPLRIVICEHELERLVLEANGFATVALAGGSAIFLSEWAPFFERLRHVYVCFDRNLASTAAAKEVKSHLPQAHIVTFPSSVAENGSITDFFVRLQRTKVDFEVLLAAAAAESAADAPRSSRVFRPYDKALRRRADRLRKAVPLHAIAEQYTTLQASGAQLMANCPFHDDNAWSFTVDPPTGTYACSVCGAEGDVVRFLIDKESLTFGQALEVLERFEFTHELFGAGA